tara:strand:- start:1366 stop:1941 length:576 start_codon:yes stop_codon:yes gene_type:complete
MSTKEIIKDLHSRPLSESLQKLLLLATHINDNELVKWVKFELTGYYGSDMSEDDVVPEYREVSGYHTDDYGRKFIIEDEQLQFINTTRLRAGIAELEVYTENGIIQKDQSTCNLIFENLNVRVTSFHVSGSQIQNLLTSVKCELIERVSKLDPQKETKTITPDTNEDIIELKPNFFGLGLNLNALKRKWFP